jgi:membrane-associated PAP2 superfamily phosphatase
MTSRVTEQRIVLVAFGALAVLFVAFPQIDLWASSLFRQNGDWLFARDATPVAIPYLGLPRLGQSTLIALSLALVVSFIKYFPRLRARRSSVAFLLAAALLGPVLLVDATLKEHSGRTRPVNIEQFGGPRQFTPAFIPANQCEKNCSFVSGHVATASFLMAFGWLAAPAIRRRWLLASLASAGFFALVRMSVGGHFLSDCVFAWFAIYFTTWGTEVVFRRLGWLPDKEKIAP